MFHLTLERQESSNIFIISAFYLLCARPFDFLKNLAIEFPPKYIVSSIVL